MLLRKLKISALALLLTDCATNPDTATAEGDIYVRAELISVEQGPGCGTFLVGSPATYRVTSGPHTLRGKRINVLIACIEMPLVQGDLSEFAVGSIHYLVITRENAHKVELPPSLPGPSWFYLKAASSHELRPNNSFKPKPLRGSA